ncbi:MAG TPA: Fic family protein [Planctomycetota bacterium]|nr:Fic family protein [Planctomycetota bacterium]
MGNLDKYINNNNLHDVDPLIKAIIIHYQFEAIHPFVDGN